MRSSRSVPELIQLVLIAAGFGGAIFAYSLYYPDNFAFLTPGEVALGFLISVSAMWVAVKLLEAEERGGPWARLMDEFCVGTGINLIVDAVLNYFEVLTRSLVLIVVGGFLAVALLGLSRLLIPRDQNEAGFVMIGYDRMAHQLASSLGLRLLGVIGSGSCPPGVTLLGNDEQFEETVARLRPARIVIADRAAAISPSRLLAQRLRGIPVSEISSLYERLLGRIHWSSFDPSDLVLSQALSTNSRTLAIQAIYTNLIGMALLIAATPLMLAVAVAIALFCGPGAVTETDEYCGFQNIPFRLTSFRTRRKDGRPSLLGTAIERSRLNRLPWIFNVVRGEMALFGPRPARRQFARRLTELMPFYAMRFSVKPGLLGWAQLKSRGESNPICELTEIEYDLYYIKRASPLLDLDILAASILGGGRRELTPLQAPHAAK